VKTLKPETFCVIRKKNIVLTPEEEVRQSFLHFLIEKKHYPACLISLEAGHKSIEKSKRSDILVKNSNLENLLLVECKAPSVKITDAVFYQILQYNLKLNAKKLVVTNGIESYCFRQNGENIEFLNDIPDYMSNDSHYNQ
jgi:hypothetical protein